MQRPMHRLSGHQGDIFELDRSRFKRATFKTVSHTGSIVLLISYIIIRTSCEVLVVLLISFIFCFYSAPCLMFFVLLSTVSFRWPSLDRRLRSSYSSSLSSAMIFVIVMKRPQCALPNATRSWLSRSAVGIFLTTNANEEQKRVIGSLQNVPFGANLKWLRFYSCCLILPPPYR